MVENEMDKEAIRLIAYMYATNELSTGGKIEVLKKNTAIIIEAAVRAYVLFPVEEKEKALKLLRA